MASVKAGEKKKKPSEAYEDALEDITTTRKLYSEACLQKLEKTFELEEILLEKQAEEFIKTLKPWKPSLGKFDLGPAPPRTDDFNNKAEELYKRMDNIKKCLAIAKNSDPLLLKPQEQKMDVENIEN